MAWFYLTIDVDETHSSSSTSSYVLRDDENLPPTDLNIELPAQFHELVLLNLTIISADMFCINLL